MRKKTNIYDSDDADRSKRLSFTPEERAARAQQKAEVLGQKLERAEKKIPKKKKIRLQKELDPQKSRMKHTLRFEEVEKQRGKAHTKSRYVEIFDREAPTVRAGIEGELLYVEANDDLSGVDKIYVCGNSFSKLTNGTLDIRLKDYADNYEKITIQAVDNAGNKSRMTQLSNPYYEPPKKDNDKNSGLYFCSRSSS